MAFHAYLNVWIRKQPNHRTLADLAEIMNIGGSPGLDRGKKKTEMWRDSNLGLENLLRCIESHYSHLA